MNKRRLLIFSAVLLFLTAVITFFGVIKPTPITPTKQEKIVTSDDLKIAIVNEDRGILYNDEQVNIANVIAKSFIDKHVYQTEMVSRSIAEKGLEKGNYQLMIVLPSKFSELALGIEEVNPEKAVFQYKIRTDKQLLLKQAEQAVADLKTDFNKDIIRIYFSSIVGNLQNAQAKVAEVVDNEHHTLNSYQSTLMQPVSGFSQQFGQIGQSSHNILDLMSGFNKAINHTQEAFTSIVSVDKSYDKAIDDVKNGQELWQKSIIDKETQLMKYNESLSQLSVDNQLKSLVDSQNLINTQFSNPEIWQNTIEKTHTLNTNIEAIINRFSEINTNIDTVTKSYEERLVEAVRTSLQNQNLSKDTINTETLNYVAEDLQQSMLSKVNTAINGLVIYNNDTINRMHISDADKQYLLNINAFINWYTTQYHQQVNLSNIKEKSYQDEHFDKVKAFINQNLLENKTLTLQIDEGTPKVVELVTDSNYVFQSVSVNGVAIPIAGNRAILETTLPKGNIVVDYTLKAVEPDEVNILSPILTKAVVKTVENVDVAKEQTVVETKIVDTPTPKTNDEVLPENISKEEKEIVKTPEETTTEKKITATENHEIIRQYSEAQAILPYENYNATYESQAVIDDLQKYGELAGVINTIFDIDISQANDFQIASTALINKANLNNLEDIIVKIVTNTSMDELKQALTINDEQIKALSDSKLQSEELEKSIGELQLSTTDLVKQLDTLVTDTTAINKVLIDKPKLEMTEKQENNDLVSVSLDMNNDLQKLMTASQSLLNSTKSNQSTSDTVKSSLENLNDTVKGLEDSGTGLSGKIEELKITMDKDYGNNEAFLKAFSNVLTNTKIGNAKNQSVYNYLSNPVDGTSIDKLLIDNNVKPVLTRQDTRSTVMIIVISYLMSLVLAHLLQYVNKMNRLTERMNWRNMIMPITMLMMMSLLTALVIANIVGYKLAMTNDQLILFNVIMLFIVLLFTAINNWLFIKARSVSLLISITILLLYIITTSHLFDVQYNEKQSILNYLSPLNYLDQLITSFINHQDGWGLSFTIIVILSLIMLVSNMFIYRKAQ